MITNAFKNKRSLYTTGCPRPRLLGCGGIGRRSTSCTKMTSSESWDTIGLPPLIDGYDYHHDRCNCLAGASLQLGFLFMTRPHLGTIKNIPGVVSVDSLVTVNP